MNWTVVGTNVSRRHSAPQWLASEAIEFMREQHPTVLSLVARMYHDSNSKTIESWLLAERHIWGLKLVNFLLQMRRNWEDEDIEVLRESWVGIMAQALKSEKLVEK